MRGREYERVLFEKKRLGKKNMKALVTGGAGLIGSHIVDLLLEKGYHVKIIDNLEPETHPHGKPSWIPKGVEFVHGDVADEARLFEAMKDVDVVFHQAAYGGFAPNQNKYVLSNTLGTSNIFHIIRTKNLPIQKIVFASSQAVYGESRYQCSQHGIFEPDYRKKERLQQGLWEHPCPQCGKNLEMMPVHEQKTLMPSTMYAVTKYTEELISFLMGKSLGIPVVGLRYSLTYGPRQSLFNPYTGICSIFSTQILNGIPPTVYEDGKQTRDFVFVEDVAQANLFVMEHDSANNEVFNVGTGKPTSVIDFIGYLAEAYGKPAEYQLTGEFRQLDVRHLHSDNSKLGKLGFIPRVTVREGIQKYADWILSLGTVEEVFSRHKEKMKQMGIIQKKG